jgi:hypothetical protein
MRNHKTQNFNLLTIGVLLAFWLLASAFQMQSKPGTRKEVKAYLKENVFPVVAEQRKKLDRELSAEEKTQIEQIRTQLKEMRQEMRANRKRFKHQEELSQEQKEQFREQRKAHRQLMNQAWEIADRHDDRIAALLEEMQEDAHKWKEDIHNMVKQERTQSYEQGENRERKGGRRAERMHRQRGHFRKNGPRHLMKVFRPVQFLLFDAQDWETSFNEPQGIDEVTAFPNPSSDQLNVEFELEKAGEIRFLLYDNNGNLIKTLYQGQQSSGTQQFSFDISQLQPGMYFYELSTPEGSKKHRFVKE